MKKSIIAAAAGLTLAFSSQTAMAHCQVPCGIYSDAQRFETIEEHIDTIAKAMVEINAGKKSTNQTVRWVLNKEKHAQYIQDIIAEYFIAQRIKSSNENYVDSLKLTHQIIVFAMKAKQTTDLKHVVNLRELVAAYEALYFKNHKGHKHGHGHPHDSKHSHKH